MSLRSIMQTLQTMHTNGGGVIWSAVTCHRSGGVAACCVWWKPVRPTQQQPTAGSKLPQATERWQATALQITPIDSMVFRGIVQTMQTLRVGSRGMSFSKLLLPARGAARLEGFSQLMRTMRRAACDMVSRCLEVGRQEVAVGGWRFLGVGRRGLGFLQNTAQKLPYGKSLVFWRLPGVVGVSAIDAQNVRAAIARRGDRTWNRVSLPFEGGMGSFGILARSQAGRACGTCSKTRLDAAPFLVPFVAYFHPI